MRYEEHSHGWNAWGLEHPRLTPSSRVWQLAELRSPFLSGSALPECDDLARPPICEAMPHHDIKMCVLLLSGRCDRLCPSPFPETLSQIVDSRWKSGSWCPPRKGKQIGTVMSISPEVALGCGQADVLKVSLRPDSRTLASLNPKLA
ncbi:MAG: hypothetical protein OXI18_02555 [bacterium]|nr:hypothetical protein [bacterium]